MLELLRAVAWQAHLPGLMRLLSTLILLVLSLVYHLQVRSDLKFSESNNQVQLALIEEARQAQDMLNANIDQYRRLRADGYIGEVQRLQWIETFSELAEALQLTNVKFTLDGSKPVQQDQDPYWRPEVAMQVTHMKLEVQLVHEGDLYLLLNGLQARAPGMFSIESCKIDWQTDEYYQRSLSRLRGICELNWYTMIDITETWSGDSV
ncbi:MAG: hypothetical protein ABJ308_04545 [Halieaceae bacterium]